MPMPLGKIIAIGALLSALVFPAQSWAGTGQAISNPALIDTADPVINLDPLPTNTLVQHGQQLTFHWTSSDANPSSQPDHYIAEVIVDESAIDQIFWNTSTSDFTWEWTAPEVQSGNCYLAVTARDTFGNSTLVTSDQFTILLETTQTAAIPTAVSLQGPYPNPFNPSCEISFTLPETGPVQVMVFDTRGRRIKNLAQQDFPAGMTRIRWDGTNQQGRPQPAGLYFLVLKAQGPAGPVKLTRKALLIP